MTVPPKAGERRVPYPFSVSGTVVGPHLGPAAVTVEVFDRDLPALEHRRGIEPQLLERAAVAPDGSFALYYTLEQFQDGDADPRDPRSSAKKADLSFRVLDADGRPLRITSIEAMDRRYEADEIIFNAPRELVVRIIADADPPPAASEYDRLIALISPVTKEISPAELTDNDMTFLFTETGLDQDPETQQRIEWLRRSAALAGTLGMPVDAFYGWGREGLPAPIAELATSDPADLPSIADKLLAATDERLEATLRKAIYDKIISDRGSTWLGRLTAHIRRLRNRPPGGDGSPPDQHRVSVRLLDARTGTPLNGYRVRAILHDAKVGDNPLGEETSQVDGRLDFTTGPLGYSPDRSQAVELSLTVTAPAEVELLDTQIHTLVDGNPTPVLVPRDGDAPVSVDVTDVAAMGGPALSEDLLARLRKLGIRTLTDLAGRDIADQLHGLSEDDNHSAAQLQSHANLFRLSQDVAANASLIGLGYSTTTAVAEARSDVFFARTRDLLGDAGAARLHVAARAQRDALRTILTGVHADLANGFQPPEEWATALPDPQSQRCSCEECETAASPLAYLTDLLDYALDHLRYDAAPVSLDWFDATFHQPFRDLPVTCETMKTMVRQVRLCAEVLRRQLPWQPPPPQTQSQLALAERRYRLRAYTSLLDQIGTSYEELRLIRDADQQVRTALADRLGFTLEPTRPDRLDALLLDEATMVEADLERLFGLVDTRITRDPLSDGPVLNDPGHQVNRWHLQGMEWNRNTDNEGFIHMVLKRLPSGDVQVELYRDQARTALIAGGERTGSVGPVPVTSSNDSGLSGTLEVSYTADTSAIALAGLPRLLCWRLARLREMWEEHDRPTTPGSPPRPPVVDPDRNSPADLRSLMTPAVGLWEGRRIAMDNLLAALHSARSGAATPADALDAALLFPQTLGQPAAMLIGLDAQRQAGTDIGPQLAAMLLPSAAFDVLVRVGRLVSTSPPSLVLDEEWAEVDAIVAAVFKSRRSAAWRAEEAAAHVTLSPDFFTPAPSPLLQFPPPRPVALPKWLTNETDRREWDRTLQDRRDQQKTVVGAVGEAISAAEEATIADLRDALVLALAPGDLDDGAKALTDRLLIDCANGTCQLTTRIAQAIETIQVLLLSVRTGQFRDTYPALSLAAPDFEAEWRWIGSYASWRSAMLVFMYPENILHPALRDRQSPGFRRLVRDSRALAAMTPDKACQLAKSYSAYFQDVCTLNVAASTTTRTRVYRGTGCRDRRAIQDRDVLHLFGLARSSTVYWATFDDAASPDPLSLWDWVPGLEKEHVLDVVGSGAYRLPDGSRFLYVFVKVLKLGVPALLFTRFDLQGGTWDTGNVALDLHRRGQDFDASVIPTDEARPPILALRHPPGGGPGSVNYRRSLNRSGNGWADGDWFPQVFSPWFRIGSLQTSPGTKVAAAASGPERLDVFTVGRDGGVYHAWWGPPANKGGWSDWTRLDPALSVQPGSPVTVLASDWLELFIAGPGDVIWTRQGVTRPNGVDWLPWTQVPGRPAYGAVQGNDVAATVSGADEITLVTLDRKGLLNSIHRRPDALWVGWFVAGPPYSWYRTPNSIGAASNLGVVYAWPPVYFRASSYYWIEKGDGGNQESAAADIPLSDGAPVSAVARSDRHVDAFMVAEDGSIQGFRMAHSAPSEADIVYDKWFRVGTLIAPKRSPVAAMAPGASHLDLFVVGRDGRVHNAWWDVANDGGWADWFPVSSAEETFPARAPLTAVSRRPGHTDLFAVGHDGRIYSSWWDQDPNAQWPQKAYTVIPPVEYRPNVDGPFELTEQLTEAALQKRRADIYATYVNNSDEPGVDPWGRNNPRRNSDYLDEAYYFVPMLLAGQLQRDRHYVSALDWYRTAYDYTMPTAQREIAYLLGRNNDWTNAYIRAKDWLVDPLNPHRIADTRPRAYVRFTLLSLIRCFLEAGDDEYTRDTAESIPRARTYYLTALELAATPELRQSPNMCETLVGQVTLELGEGHYEALFHSYRQRLIAVNDISTINAATGELQQLQAAADLNAHQRILRAGRIVASAEAKVAGQPIDRMAAVLSTARMSETRIHDAMLAVPEIERGSREAATLAGDQMISGIAAAAGTSVRTLIEERPALPWMNGVWDAAMLNGDAHQPLHAGSVELGDPLFPWYAADIVGQSEEVYVPAPSLAFCLPPNPVLRTLRLHAEMNLYNLRHCRNIAGMERQLDPYAAPTDVTTDLPVLNDSGRLSVPGLAGMRPTPYHYRVLVERAMQLAQMAAQFENSMLSATEKRDIEAYSLLKARHDAELMTSQVRLQELRVSEAESSVVLSQLQQRRAELARDHWQELLHEDVSSPEQASLDALYVAAGLYAHSALSNMIAAATPSLASIFTFGSENVQSAAQAMATLAQVSSTSSQILALQASYERRREDWSYQRILSQADVQIANQSITIAQDHLMVTQEERLIAGLQVDNAAAGVEFLANKFTNADLYDWMGNIFERIYRWFLQQATATAQLAATQLGFERQEVPPPFIQADYWDAPSETAAAGSQPADRRGLTGSARLLQDIFQLDQHAFEKNARKLQLSKTMSLGQIAPVELTRFRQSGVLPFATTLEMFDRDFPGHCLRLISKVRLSVIALVPPSQGIRATLSCTGSSRVVIADPDGLIHTVVVRRDPQRVALSSAISASGVFDLDPQPELLMPFEGLGVETQWELRMPRAANPFDFASVADVLLSIDYTAVDNYAHAEQVMHDLGRELSYDRALSFLHELSDAWYALHNPSPGGRPTVRFKTTRSDYAPNMENLRIQHVAMLFTLTDGPPEVITVSKLGLSTSGGPAVGGGGSTTDGLISTRRGNANWSALQGREPIGEWELTFPDTPLSRTLLTSGRIADIILVITYEGLSPAWPA